MLGRNFSIFYFLAREQVGSRDYSMKRDEQQSAMKTTTATLPRNIVWYLVLGLFILELNGCAHSAYENEVDNEVQVLRRQGHNSSQEGDVLFVAALNDEIRDELAGKHAPGSKTWRDYWHTRYASMRTLNDPLEVQQHVEYVHLKRLQAGLPVYDDGGRQ